MSVADHLSRAFEAADRLVLECRAPGESGGGLSAGQLAGNSNPLAALSGDGRTAADRQLSRMRGWEATAVRAIGQRLAGQRVHVAVQRLGKGRDKRAPVGVKSVGGVSLGHGRRVPEYHKMPRQFKDAALLASDGWEELESHPLLDAINDPNEFMVTWSLLYLLGASLELTGVAYWWLREVDGKTQIWYLPKSWVTPCHTDEQLFASWKVQAPGMKEPEILAGDDVVPFYYPNVGSPLEPSSPSEAQADASEIERMSQSARKNSLRNGGLPQHALVIGDPSDPTNVNKRLSPESYQKDALIDNVRKLYRNSRRLGDPLILDSIVREVRDISTPLAEQGLDATEENSKQRLLLGHGVNPVIVGQLEGANRASSATADQHFCGSTMNPKIELLSQCMTAWLGPRFAKAGERLWVWIEVCVPLDEQRLNWFTLLDRQNRVTDNELRAEVNLPPVEGGDEYPPKRAAPAPAVAPGVAPAGGGSGAPAAADEDGEGADEGEEAGKARVPGRLKLPYRKADWLAKAGELWLKRHGESEQKLAAALEAFFGAKAEGIVSKLVAGAVLTADELVAVEAWTSQMVEVLTPRVLEAATGGAATELAMLDLTVQISPGVMTSIQRSVVETMRQPYWKGVVETTRDQLANVITEWVREGEPLRELVKRVESTIGGAGGRERATLIARTEATNAQNAGHFHARQELIEAGLILGSEWLSQGLDPLVRATHAAAHGQVTGEDGMFEVGGFRVPWPGHFSLPARERCNCRCTSVAAADFTDLPDEAPQG
jgi:phage portal protein BeeE